MPPIVNPLPFVFIFATAFGVMTHDTKVDHAASVAIVSPVNVADFSLAHVVSQSDDHTHVERVSTSGHQGSTHTENVPKTSPRNDHNRYSQGKKSNFSGGSGNSLWPST